MATGTLLRRKNLSTEGDETFNVKASGMAKNEPNHQTVALSSPHVLISSFPLSDKKVMGSFRGPCHVMHPCTLI